MYTGTLQLKVPPGKFSLFFISLPNSFNGWLDFLLYHRVVFWHFIGSVVRSKTDFNLTYLNEIHDTEHIFVTGECLVVTKALVISLTTLSSSHKSRQKCAGSQYPYQKYLCLNWHYLVPLTSFTGMI